MYFIPSDDLVEHAACANLDEEGKRAFFGKKFAEAKRICKSCPVVDECLEDTLRRETPGERRYGTFGAMTANERTKRYG